MVSMIDLTGMRFGRWTVLGKAENRKPYSSMWMCKCTCGTVRPVGSSNLRRGYSKSCGCLSIDVARVKHLTHGIAVSIVYKREYRSWAAAKQRCFNPKDRQYKHYGARGITMCKEWKDSFWQFISDMGPCPEGYTIERVDNNKGYMPNNCIWASMQQQLRNTRRNVWLEYNGERLICSEWARKLGVTHEGLRKWLKNHAGGIKGWVKAHGWKQI